jgi:urea transport system permease protein
MFGYSLGELGSILAMQGFAGLILFSVYLLMALGLAIIFGQMGVINMAHGEFMIPGAYMTYFCSHLFASYLPGLYAGYFFVAMIVAFIASGTVGLFVEWALIQRLYRRPLDTLLATWGLSLIMQQAFRSAFGAREVGVELPPWMMGSLQVTDTIEVQINSLFVMGLTTPPASRSCCSARAGACRCAASSPIAPWPARWASTRGGLTGSLLGSAAALPASPAALSP